MFFFKSQSSYIIDTTFVSVQKCFAYAFELGILFIDYFITYAFYCDLIFGNVYLGDLLCGI